MDRISLDLSFEVHDQTRCCREVEDNCVVYKANNKHFIYTKDNSNAALYVCHHVTLHGNKHKLNMTPLTCSTNLMAEHVGIEPPLKRETAGI